MESDTFLDENRLLELSELFGDCYVQHAYDNMAAFIGISSYQVGCSEEQLMAIIGDIAKKALAVHRACRERKEGNNTDKMQK
jgi:hypothetical protein